MQLAVGQALVEVLGVDGWDIGVVVALADQHGRLDLGQ
jgi:hypothetical protein